MLEIVFCGALAGGNLVLTRSKAIMRRPPQTPALARTPL